jgi:hypothetical protein
LNLKEADQYTDKNKNKKGIQSPMIELPQSKSSGFEN